MTPHATRSRPSPPAPPATGPDRIRKGDISWLWAGQTVSMFGDEITGVALPTVALLALNASPLQFGLIGASSYLPYPVLGLLAGAWIDRARRKVVLLIADLVRGAAIASIPVAVLARTITITQLVIVGLIVGTASVFFNSAYQAYLPHIVASDDLNKANARLSISETASQVAGPTMAGGLISLAGVGGAMFADAFSFLVSVVSVMFIRRPEQKPERRRGSLIPEVRDGLRLVIRNRLLLGLTLTSAISNLGRGMALGLVVLFAYKGLHLSPALVGVMMAAGNAGPFLGSLVSQRFTGRFGIGPALLIGSVMKGLPWVFIPAALLGASVPVVVAVMVVSGFFIPISNVTTLTIRQTLVSSDMQGRVAATVRTVTRTAVPLATILGGALGQVGIRLLGPRAGLATVLTVGGLIWLSAGLLLPRDLLRQVRSTDDLESAVPAAADEVPQQGKHQRGAGRSRHAGAARLALGQTLLLSEEPPLWAHEPPLWAEEPYRPTRVTGPAMQAGYGNGAYPRTYRQPAGPSPVHQRAAGQPPVHPRGAGQPASRLAPNAAAGNGSQLRPRTRPQPASPPVAHSGPAYPPPAQPTPYPRPAQPAPAYPQPAQAAPAYPQPAQAAAARPQPAAPRPPRPPYAQAAGPAGSGNQPHPGTHPYPGFASPPSAYPRPPAPPPPYPQAAGLRATNPQPALPPPLYSQPPGPWPANPQPAHLSPRYPPVADPWAASPQPAHLPPPYPPAADPRAASPEPAVPRPADPWPGDPWPGGQPASYPAADEVMREGQGPYPAATGRTARGRRGTGRP